MDTAHSGQLSKRVKKTSARRNSNDTPPAKSGMGGDESTAPPIPPENVNYAAIAGKRVSDAPVDLHEDSDGSFKISSLLVFTAEIGEGEGGLSDSEDKDLSDEDEDSSILAELVDRLSDAERWYN